jgi:hypothetical protein
MADNMSLSLLPRNLLDLTNPWNKFKTSQKCFRFLSLGFGFDNGIPFLIFFGSFFTGIFSFQLCIIV